MTPLLMWALTSQAPHAGAPTTTVTLVSENDSPWSLMWKQPYRDEYYTNGAWLSRTRRLQPSDTDLRARAVDDLATTLGLGTAETTRIALAQTMYTPVAIWDPGPQPWDHPWAAHLFVAGGMTARRSGWVSSVEAQVGVTGPPALGEPIQKWVHEVLSGDEPVGWHHQNHTEPTAGLAVGLAREDLVPQTDDTIELRLVPAVLWVAGTTDLAAQADVLVGIGTTGDVPTVRPEQARFGHGMVGQARRGEDTVGFAVFGFVSHRATVHDAFVEGGTFTHIEAPVALPLLRETGVGMQLRVQSVVLSMTANHHTESFEHQWRSPVFGTLSVSVDR